jgi:hypothetical protein
MADKIIDFKKITDKNLIKLWVEHYKEYAENNEKRLLTKQETQDLYNEGYKRGLGSKLILLYNSLYALQMTARQEINYQILRLFTLSDRYIAGFNKLQELAQLYELKATDKDIVKYREQVAELIIAGVELKLDVEDKNGLLGEEALEEGIKSLKRNILFCRKVQELVEMDIMSDNSKQQIQSAREMILLITGELSNGIDYLKYKLGVGKAKTIKRDEDFYNFINKHIGVEKLVKKMDLLDKIITKHRNSKGLIDYVKEKTGAKVDVEKARKTMFDYPTENYGLTEADIKKIEGDIERLKSLRTL